MRYLEAIPLILAACGTPHGVRVATAETTRRPLLAWQAFPTERQLAANPILKRIGPVSYDLRIVRQDDESLAYERRGIEGTSHRVEVDLPAATLFRWTVRPRFDIDGSPRVGEWSHRTSPVGPMSGTGDQTIYCPAFRTPP